MVLVYMLTSLGYIDGIHVTIYSSTMDPSWVMNQLCYGGPAWRGDGILLISSRASRQFPRILQPSKDSGTPDPSKKEVLRVKKRHDVSKAIGSTIPIFTIFMDTNHQLIWFIWLAYDIALLTWPLNQCFIMTFRNFWFFKWSCLIMTFIFLGYR